MLKPKRRGTSSDADRECRAVPLGRLVTSGDLEDASASSLWPEEPEVDRGSAVGFFDDGGPVVVGEDIDCFSEVNVAGDSASKAPRVFGVGRFGCIGAGLRGTVVLAAESVLPRVSLAGFLCNMVESLRYPPPSKALDPRPAVSNEPTSRSTL